MEKAIEELERTEQNKQELIKFIKISKLKNCEIEKLAGIKSKTLGDALIKGSISVNKLIKITKKLYEYGKFPNK